MLAVMPGRVDGDQIYCTVPAGQTFENCVLKLFVLDQDLAPSRPFAFVFLPPRA